MNGIYVAFLVVACNMSAYRASKVLVSLFAIELGASQIFIGLLVSLYSLLPLLVALYAGRMSDRLGVRVPMALGSAGISLGLVVPFVWPTLTGLGVSAALIGGSHVFYNVSVQNLIGYLSGPDTRTRNFSNYGLVMSIGSLIGPMSAGFSIDHYGHANSYIFAALVPLASIAILWSVPGLQNAQATAGTKEKAHGFTAGARDLLKNAPLRRTLIASGIVLTGVDLFQFYMPIYGHSIGLSASAIGIVLGVFAAATFVVRIWLPRLAKRLGEDTMLTWSLFLGALTYLIFPLTSHPLLIGAIAFVLGLALGCSQPLSLTLTFSRAPEGRSGETLGLRLTINNFTHLVVPLLFGTIGSLFGVAPVFLANAAMLAGGGTLSRRSERALKTKGELR